jgi:hypothetical protein
MSATTFIAFRVPKRMADDLKTLAGREANGLSATARRLLALGLAAAQDSAQPAADRQPAK